MRHHGSHRRHSQRSVLGRGARNEQMKPSTPVRVPVLKPLQDVPALSRDAYARGGYIWRKPGGPWRIGFHDKAAA